MRPSGRSCTAAAFAVSTIGSTSVGEVLVEGGEEFLVCLLGCWAEVVVAPGFKRGPTVFLLARSTLDPFPPPESSASDRDPFASFGLLKSESYPIFSYC